MKEIILTTIEWVAVGRKWVRLTAHLYHIIDQYLEVVDDINPEL